MIRQLTLLATLLLAACNKPTPPPPTSPDQAAPPPPAEITSDRLVAHIRALPARRSANGDTEHREGLEETQRILIERVKALGYEPETHRVNWDTRPRRDDEREWLNISFDLAGTDAPDDILVVSAHFDAVPNCPGADDDGSGVAAVLELARVLRNEPLRQTVRFCLFNLEEVGLIGSTQYAQVLLPQLREQGETFTGMMSLEMLAYYRDEPDSQQSPIKMLPSGPAPTVGDFIAVAGIQRHQEAFSGPLIEAMRETEPDFNVLAFDFFPIPPPDLLRSDHAPFLFQEIPAVMIADTANFRNPHYHQPTDTIDTLDLERFQTCVRAIEGAIRKLAG